MHGVGIRGRIQEVYAEGERRAAPWGGIFVKISGL